MFGTLHISVDSNSPSLILTSLAISVETSLWQVELWTKEEDVDATEAGNLVEVLNDEGLERRLILIQDQTAFDIYDRAAL